MSAASASGKSIPAEGEETFVLPRAQLPEIIVSNVPGTWAYDTMVRGDRVLCDDLRSLSMRAWSGWTMSWDGVWAGHAC